MQRTTVLYLVLIATIIIWGNSFVIVDIAIDEGSSPVMLAMARFLIASAIFATYLVWRRPQGIGRVYRKTFLWLAFVGIGVYYVFQYYGVALAGAAISAIIVTLFCPIMIFMLSAWRLGEKIPDAEKFGLGLSAVGCLLVITNGSVSSVADLEVIIGGIFGLICALLWAIYTVDGKQILRTFEPMTSTAYITILGTIMMVPFAAVDVQMTGQAYPPSFFIAAIYLGVLCTVIGYVFWFRAITGLDVRTAGVMLYFEPVVTVLFAWALLGDMIGWVTAIGGVLTMVGVVIVSRN